MWGEGPAVGDDPGEHGEAAGGADDLLGVHGGLPEGGVDADLALEGLEDFVALLFFLTVPHDGLEDAAAAVLADVEPEGQVFVHVVAQVARAHLCVEAGVLWKKS